MKRIFGLAILAPLSALIISGCEEPTAYGSIDNAVVADKRTEEHCARGCWNDYFVIVEKNGDKIELEIDEENVFNAFIVGNTVNLSYDDKFYVIDIEFPLIQENAEEKTVDNDKK